MPLDYEDRADFENAERTKLQLLGPMSGQGVGDIEHSGDTGVLVTLLGLLDTPDPVFAIATP